MVVVVAARELHPPESRLTRLGAPDLGLDFRAKTHGILIGIRRHLANHALDPPHDLPVGLGCLVVSRTPHLAPREPCT